MEALLAAGADKDVVDSDGATALCTASYKGHADVVEVLLAAGAREDKANNNGDTPLCIASDDELGNTTCDFAHNVR